jgi:hypothetical protein
MRRTRQPCAICRKSVIHVNGQPYAAHVRGALHRAAVERAADEKRRAGRPPVQSPAPPSRAWILPVRRKALPHRNPPARRGA